MRALFFDCFSGISGDMTLGALLDVSGAKEDFLKEMDKLSIRDEFELDIKKAVKKGISGTSVEVIVKPHGHDHDHHHHEENHNHEEHNHEHHHEEDKHEEHHHRGLSDINKIIEESDLEIIVKQIAKSIFKTLAEAEAKVHGTTVEEIHFHEVGAVDSIVDIVGTAVLLNIIKPEMIICSPINTGSGTVKCAHGIMPVPAPATAEILQGLKYYAKGEGERTTPTGASILKTFAYCAMDLPSIIADSIGYGIGKSDFEEMPNVLRVFMGEVDNDAVADKAAVIEANIDDMTPEALGACINEFMEQGALDVYFTPIYMKKSRPAYKLSLICTTNLKDKFETLILKNTTTLGVRSIIMDRKVLTREVISQETPYGDVRIKKASGFGIERFKPEYEDVVRVAKEYELPYDEAVCNIMKVIDYEVEE
ncbi:MAG: nickel pincer cofactor biosynthesis protein LarC [Eubacteriales bacterium]